MTGNQENAKLLMLTIRRGSNKEQQNSLQGMPHQLDSAMVAAQAANKQSAAEGHQTTPFTQLAQKHAWQARQQRTTEQTERKDAKP